MAGRSGGNAGTLGILGGGKKKTTSSLLPKVHDGAGYVDAIADIPENSADLLELSSGEYCHTGKVTWAAHGLNVGSWYYLDQNTAGVYTDVKPTSGIVQQLFHVEDANTIHIDIEEAYNIDSAQFVVYLDDDNARNNLTNPQPDTLYIVKDSLNDGSNIAKSWTYDIANLQWQENETEIDYSLDDATVDLTDPNNPVFTIPLLQNNTMVSTSEFTVPIPSPVSVVDSIDFLETATPNEFTVQITYTDDNGIQQTVVDTTPVDLSNFLSVITNTVAGNRIFTHTANGVPVDVFESDTPITDNGDGSFSYESELGEPTDIYPSFQILYCAPPALGCLGQTGLTFQPEVVNVLNGPVVWSLDSTAGVIINGSIDSATGEITFDLTNTPVNNGTGAITITATDAGGMKTTAVICLEANDPVDKTQLACNGDLQANSPDIVSKLILFAKADLGLMFQDSAKTIPATNTGDPVSVLEDATGTGDIITNNTAPNLELASSLFNNRNVLTFNGVDQSLEYQVPSAPAVGSPFKFFALFSMTPGTVAANGTLLCSTSVGNNNSTGTNTWQFSQGAGDGNFVARNSGTWGNILVQTGTNTGPDVNIATLAEVADGQPHLFYANYFGSAGSNRLQVYLDGVLRLDAESTVPLAAEYFKIFENRAGADFIGGNLAEMLYADPSMTNAEATVTQAYFLCKYGLDASLIADPGPFAVDKNEFFETVSQFELQTLCTGEEIVYDTFNDTYYPLNDVPTPGLGLFRDPTVSQILADSGLSSWTGVLPTGTDIGTHDNGQGLLTTIRIPPLKIQKATTDAAGMDRERVVRDEDGVPFLQAGRIVGLATGSSSADLVGNATLNFDNAGTAEAYITDHVFVFPEAFSQVPVVTVSFTDQNTTGHISVTKVTTLGESATGFTLRIYDYESSLGIDVNWIAVA